MERNLFRDKPDLLVDFCDYKAAKFAVMNWHYSKSMPAGKLVKIGAWEDKRFIGCVLFGLGANMNIHIPFLISRNEACELVRIALTSHIAPVSRIMKIALKMMKGLCPSLRLVVSYADPYYNHHGGIYQAMNWVFVGNGNTDSRSRHPYLNPKGKLVHWRTVSSQCARVGISHTEKGAKELGYRALPPRPPKYKYLYPLDKKMRRQILPLSQPYPKRADVV